jgi:nucleoside permease NupC
VDKRRVAVIRNNEQTTESALCVGVAAALVWGIALSFHALNLTPGEISWMEWLAQLLGGIMACLLVPLAWVRGAFWVAAKLTEGRAREAALRQR